MGLGLLVSLLVSSQRLFFLCALLPCGWEVRTCQDGDMQPPPAAAVMTESPLASHLCLLGLLSQVSNLGRGRVLNEQSWINALCAFSTIR